MGDSENMEQSSKKRCASTQLTPLNSVRDDEEDSTELENGTFKKASDEVLATRRILKIKRREPSATSQAPNPFAGIRLVPTTAPNTAAAVTNTPMAESKPSPAEATDESKQKTPEDGRSDTTLKTDDIKTKDDNDNQCENRSDADTVEGTDQTADPVKVDSGVDKTEIKETEVNGSEETDKNGDNSPISSFQQHSTNKNAFTGLASTEASGSSFSFGLIPQDGSTGSASLFNFDFAKNGNSSLFGGSSSSSIINKSEASSAFPPKQEVSVETGEENERVAFSADSVMFEYIDGGWKERGKGEVKVNVSSNGKSRLVMRAKGNYRLILNASLYPEMKLTSMDKKGITFACVNSIEEGNKEGLSTFALKFKDPLVVDTFRAAVHKHKESKPVEAAAAEVAETPLKTPENSPTDE